MNRITNKIGSMINWYFITSLALIHCMLEKTIAAGADAAGVKYASWMVNTITAMIGNTFKFIICAMGYMRLM